MFFTSTLPATRKLLKKDKIKLGKLKLVKENLVELEEKLGLTTNPPPTTPEPTTEPYTGPSTRKTTACSFDPDYFFDQNWPLKQFKRLKREVSETRYENKLDIKVSFLSNYCQNLVEKNSLGASSSVNIFPSGNKWQFQPSKNKMWIKSKRFEFGISNLNTDILKFLRFQKYLKKTAHFKVKRDLGAILRRSTKRPHLSRKFKSQSMKRFMQDSRLASLLTSIQSNITIVPEFIRLKQVMDDCKRYNLSTLFYVYDNVAYFGSVPPQLLLTTKFDVSTKLKPVTFELGVTKVLGANFFDDDKKVRETVQKVLPSDVEIPNINAEEAAKKAELSQSKSIINDDKTDITDSEVSKTTKSKRGRKRKIEDINDISNDTSKRTRIKKKSTKPYIDNSLENTPSTLGILDTNATKNKTKRRKSRSINVEVMDILTPLLFFSHKNMNLRKKRNVGNSEKETRDTENQPEKKNNGHFGKLKEHIKRSKDNIVSFVKEKKEALVDMPRRARYIAREMYLDGKFFFQELKEVPRRMKKDYAEKKEMFGLVWDMLKIFMPATEVGEKGGTTPEPKVVEDPKQYVKDFVTPDLSEPFETTKKISFQEEQTLEEITEKTSISTFRLKPKEELRTPIFKTEARTTEKTSIFFKTERLIHDNIQSSLLRTSTSEISMSSTSISKTNFIGKNKNEPILITSDISREKVYHTRVVGPEYTIFSDNVVTETTKNIFQKAFEEKINDEHTFDRISQTMKDKRFMENLLKNADTDRLQKVMENLNPADMFKKMDEKTVNKMGKLMSELDADTIKNMQDLARRSYGLLTTLNTNKINNR